MQALINGPGKSDGRSDWQTPSRIYKCQKLLSDLGKLNATGSMMIRWSKNFKIW
mgnify:CR=1 FL=1|jgi:hypothetical protein